MKRAALPSRADARNTRNCATVRAATVNPLVVSAIVFAVTFGGVFAGAFLRHALPQDQLAEDAKDVVRLGTGLIGTIAALVLGLLISSGNTSYNTANTQVNCWKSRARRCAMRWHHYDRRAAVTPPSRRGA
jgi:hypothetical protein